MAKPPSITVVVSFFAPLRQRAILSGRVFVATAEMLARLAMNVQPMMTAMLVGMVRVPMMVRVAKMAKVEKVVRMMTLL